MNEGHGRQPLPARRCAAPVVAAAALLLSACATSKSGTLHYDALVAGDLSPRSAPAQVTKDAEKILRDKGYFKIGRISVVQVIEDDGKQIAHSGSPANRAAREAAARGADLVRLEKEDARESQVLHKRGACLRTERVLQPTTTCSIWGTDDDGVAVCRVQGVTHKYVTQCAEFEQIPYTRVLLRSEGSIWRHDPPRVAADRALRKALAADSAAELERRIAQRPSVEAPLLDGRRPLSVAVAAGNAGAVRLLLDRGAKPGPADLRLATERGHSAVARLLIEHKPGAGRDKAADQSALWAASVLGQTAVVEALLARGADPGARDDTDGQNALHKAAWACRLDTVKLLIARGADPKATTEDGERAVDLARSSSSWSRRSPAERAACHEIVELLGRRRHGLRPAGGDLSALDGCGGTLIMTTHNPRGNPRWTDSIIQHARFGAWWKLRCGAGSGAFGLAVGGEALPFEFKETLSEHEL